ncbi:hypothetical protein [Azonexus hydrophilus]|uniref:Transcriptional regulator n=1 Tax=Azonexus hydrophilus TaxID=418702 RepID=A0ABZ2XMW2_9RHOO
MTSEQFRAYQAELGGLTHGATATLLGVSEVTVKRYATGHLIPEQTAKLLRALVLLRRLKKMDKLMQMA